MRKRIYELTVIFTPVLKEQGLSSAISAVEALTKKHKGKVVEVENQGKQKFAYTLHKYKEGIYIFWKLLFPRETINNFETELKIQKGILRHLIVATDETAK